MEPQSGDSNIQKQPPGLFIFLKKQRIAFGDTGFAGVYINGCTEKAVIVEE
jgi:hypothetical protein